MKVYVKSEDQFYGFEQDNSQAPDAEKMKRAKTSSSISELQQLFIDSDWRIRLAIIKNPTALKNNELMKLAGKDPCYEIRHYVQGKIMERWRPKKRYY